jgi:hypothetical protein
MPTSACLWLASGETGLSSEAMFWRFVQIYGVRDLRVHPKDHPYDPDDLKRCRLLLEQVPEFAAFLPAMADMSSTWKRLVDHWDELCSLMDAECPDWRDGRFVSPTKTYALMQKLRC